MINRAYLSQIYQIVVDLIACLSMQDGLAGVTNWANNLYANIWQLMLRGVAGKQNGTILQGDEYIHVQKS